MRRRTQQPVLQVLTESIVDGKGNDERSDPGCNSGDRDAGDNADDSLAAFGAEVASRDEEFEAHKRSYQLSAHTAGFDYSEAVSRSFIGLLSWARQPAPFSDNPGIPCRIAAQVPFLPIGSWLCP